MHTQDMHCSLEMCNAIVTLDGHFIKIHFFLKTQQPTKLKTKPVNGHAEI